MVRKNVGALIRECEAWRRWECSALDAVAPAHEGRKTGKSTPTGLDEGCAGSDLLKKEKRTEECSSITCCCRLGFLRAVNYFAHCTCSVRSSQLACEGSQKSCSGVLV
ncbi:hypothetical protein DUNSADRAFT_11408 [Dunaliella salina]|uniref:Uncharacterized protein n=1 Tax=Dunaliella salina TaxID=3046 RepID=A0ABQ7GDN2_DUNSA|nr:hypothetical protein DUNSADRAFT_11408 [Dunaliella salina]|eukprot:KAF5832663.1 hypothetical protein DUNSADRAFT_11408 [Dunaliella salina]